MCAVADLEILKGRFQFGQVVEEGISLLFKVFIALSHQKYKAFTIREVQICTSCADSMHPNDDHYY